MEFRCPLGKIFGEKAGRIVNDQGRTTDSLLLRRDHYCRALIQHGRCVEGFGLRGHSAFRIQQVLFVRSQSQLDQCPGIGNHLALPAIVRLEALHRALRLGIPNAGRTAVQVVFPNQRLLNFAGAFRIDLLLATLGALATSLALAALVEGLSGSRSGNGSQAGLRPGGRSGSGGRGLRGSYPTYQEQCAPGAQQLDRNGRSAKPQVLPL